MKAMILAAGYGTRLGILSKQRPKPLLPVGNVPLVVHAIETLKAAGIVEIAINAHHKGDKLMTLLGDGSQFGVSLLWSEERDTILGTGGGVKKVAPFFDEEGALIMNGKMVTDLDLSQVLRFHRERHAFGTMVLRHDPNAARWGSIGVNNSGTLVSMLGKNALGEPVPSAPTMFTGISVLSPAFLEALPHGPSCMVRQGWKPAFSLGRPLAGFVMPHSTYWWEHSTPERYLMGNKNLFTHNLLDRLHPPLKSAPLPYWVTATHPDQLLLHPTAVLGEGVTLNEMVVVGEGAILDPGVTLRECVVWPHTHVTTSHEHAILTPKGPLVVETTEGGGFTGPSLKP